MISGAHAESREEMRNVFKSLAAKHDGKKPFVIYADVDGGII
jgi:hypothetical protein